jgi:hypothetical protein
MQNRLYVSNIAEGVAASTLQELFEPYSFVMDVKLAAEAGNGHAPGSTWVTMATDEAARVATRALDGACVQGVMIRLEAVPEERAGAEGMS